MYLLEHLYIERVKTARMHNIENFNLKFKCFCFRIGVIFPQKCYTPT